MRVAQLVDVEAVPQCLGEPHRVAGRIHRVLDQQRRHGRPLGDAARKLERLVLDSRREQIGLAREVEVERALGQPGRLQHQRIVVREKRAPLGIDRCRVGLIARLELFDIGGVAAIKE